MERIHLRNLLRGKYSAKQVIDYFRAELRYFIYFDYFGLEDLMRTHIREQIDFRIYVMMDLKCYADGQCKKCGCTTPDLQFTNSSCDGFCYPPLVDKKTWEQFKRAGNIIEKRDCEAFIWTNTVIVEDRFIKTNKNFINFTHVGQTNS